MSFYAHPFARRQAPAQHQSYGYGYPFATAPAPSPSPAPSFNFFTAPPAHAYNDIDAEEQAALAHLRSIQQRREAAQAAARREAAIQAQVAAQREAAYIAAVERERARDDAIRRIVEAKQRQEAAVAHAIAERERRVRYFRAQREAAAAQHAKAIAAREAERQAVQEHLARRNACARRCANGCARKERPEQKEQEKAAKDEWKEVNDVLASLFGLEFFGGEGEGEMPTQEKEKETAVPEVKEKEKVEEPAESKAAAADKVDEKPAAAKTEDKAERVELDFNDLLSRVLGVSLEPATANDKPTEGAEALTAKLNDFLGHFGLEFDTVDFGRADNKAESSSSAPAPATAPAAAAAPKDASVEGKGKAVAEGERPARPASPAAKPVPEATAAPSASAFDKLRDISHELHLATESFTFPAKLTFADTVNADATPALLFNKGNSGYHAQAHKLLQLLLAADGISSGGDREVRKQRKAIVKAIEGAIEKLEQQRDAVWAEVKEKREHGAESSDDEGSVSSWNSTEPEHIEHATEDEAKASVEVAVAENVKAEEKAAEEEVAQAEQEVDQAEKEVDQAEQEAEQADQVEKVEAEQKDEQTYAQAAAEAGSTEVKGFEVPAEAKQTKADKANKDDEYELV